MHTDLALSLDTLLSFLLLLARVAGALIFVPLPFVPRGPEPVRALLAFGLAAALWPLAPPTSFPNPGIGQMVAWILSEATLGITIGVAVSFLLEALLVAAQVFGLQAGYSYAATIDPSTQADSNLLVVFAQLMGSLLFLSLGMDRQVLRIFALSLAAVPPGTYLLKPLAADVLVRLGADMFSTGLRLAMPIVLLLVLVDLALALLGKMHQQLQLLTLAFPAKMLAALAFLAAISVYFVPVWRAMAGRTLLALRGLF